MNTKNTYKDKLEKLISSFSKQDNLKRRHAKLLLIDFFEAIDTDISSEIKDKGLPNTILIPPEFGKTLLEQLIINFGEFIIIRQSNALDKTAVCLWE